MSTEHLRCVERRGKAVRYLSCNLYQQSVMTELSGHLEKLYPELHDHMFESAADSNHFVRLVKWVIASYIKIRMHHTAKKATTKVTGSNIRKQLTKLILFKHQ
ncbi:hypothetical protein HPB51_011584 [Rhipicephalus microplus]|uniref:DNA transposase THAP9 C-terminal domain-containing protein n=1 Tax=Rhipicephalus microplus TaxID=6941 RepID=A0A9J6E9G7_RHIMP|nr:hypothetical protein HPB51_011584 [Rhipicephalus microplus]